MTGVDHLPPVGCIGLGRMGGAIAARLLAAGHPLVVHDPDDRACEPLMALGARRVGSPRDVADATASVVACLPTPEVSHAVALGPDGIAGGTAIRNYVEMSTIGPAMLRTIATALSPHGIVTVDAPVSGGPRASTEGRLTLILAGQDESLAAVGPMLDVIGVAQTRVGNQPGMAQLAKLVNNALSLVGMALAAEAIVVGVKAGLDADALLAVVNAGTGRNAATMDKFPSAVLTRRFDYGGPLGAAVKDLDLFLAEAATQGVPARVTQAGEQLWRFAADQGDPQRDFTTIVQLVEQWAGVEVAGRAAIQAKEQQHVR